MTEELLVAVCNHACGMGGDGAARIARALARPGTDPEADRALAEYAALHERFDDLTCASMGHHLEMPMNVAPAKPATDYHALFDRLIAVYEAKQPADSGSEETAITSAVTAHLTASDAERRKVLNDPTQLWPVLVELAARRITKPGREPEYAKLAKSKRFSPSLKVCLLTAFEADAKDDVERSILASQLFGRRPDEIARTLAPLQAHDVSAKISTLHARLAHRLYAK